MHMYMQVSQPTYIYIRIYMYEHITHMYVYVHVYVYIYNHNHWTHNISLLITCKNDMQSMGMQVAPEHLNRSTVSAKKTYVKIKCH